MEIDGNHRKQRKASETTENIGNNGKHRKQRKTSETTENVGNVGIGTGGNMVHDKNYIYPQKDHPSKNHIEPHRTSHTERVEKRLKSRKSKRRLVGEHIKMKGIVQKSIEARE